MKKVDIYSTGFLYCSVCADNSLSIEEITAKVNQLNPSGTMNGWCLSKEGFRSGEANQCECEEYPESRRHYLFSC